MRDPYSVLGVERNAGQAEIKKAYRRLAKHLHPDRNREDAKAAQKFSDLNQAYEIIGDEKQRARYDRGEIGEDGKEKFAGFAGGGARAGGSGFEGFNFDLGGMRNARRQRADSAPGFEDILSNLFGGSFGGDAGFEQPQATPQKAPDATATLHLSFIEAAKGTEKQVSLSNGKVLKVNIPAGSSSGDTLRLKGQAESSPGMKPGDLLLNLDVAAHPLFKTDGKNLRLTLPISLDEAVLGARIRVPTLDGAVELTIPAGSSSGKAMRLKGKGLFGKAGTGDLYVKLAVVLPLEPDQALKDYAAQLRAMSPYDVRGPEFNG